MYLYKSVWHSENRDAATSVEASVRDDPADEPSSSINHTDTSATCYNLDRSSMGSVTTDSMIEYSDETDQVDEDITVDLQIRMRRYNEETANLKSELLRAEETISSLDSEVKSKQVNLERISIKYGKLQKELENLKELLTKSEKQEETYRQEAVALQKAFVALQKKLQHLEKKLQQLEKEKEDNVNLRAQIDELSKKKSEYIKQINDCKSKYDQKYVEYEDLQKSFEELQKNYTQLESYHEKTIKQHLEQIEELQNLNNVLQNKLNSSNDSFNSQSSVTPPPYSSIHLHSTPYMSKRLSCHDSLYTELKESGFHMEEAKIQDLKEQLSLYDGEISSISDQIDEALKDIATSRNEIYAPSVQLVETTSSIQSLKHKITTLLKLIKSCPAVKELREPLMGEASREKPDVLPLPKKGSYVFSDRDFASDKGDNNLLATVPPKIVLNGYCNKTTAQQLFEISGIEKLDVSNGEESNEGLEVIVVGDEVLKKLTALNETIDSVTDQLPPRNPKHKSIFTVPKKSNLSALIADLEAKGDSTYCIKPKIIQRSNSDSPKSAMKTLKDETTTTNATSTSCKDFESSASSTPIPKLDTRYVTMHRPSDKTFVVNPMASSTVEMSQQQQQCSFDEVRSEIPYRRTPNTASPMPGPKRKLSVYHRSFDVDSLQQTPDKVQSVINSEKKRSISTPDALQETAKEQLTSYRCSNLSTGLSDSSSSKNDGSGSKDLEDSVSPIKYEKQEPLTKTISKPLIAPTRFQPLDVTVFGRDVELTPMVGKGILSMNNPASLKRTADYDVAQQSKILSSSENLVKKKENGVKEETPTITFDASTVDSFKLELESTDGVVDKSAGDTESRDTSNNALLPNDRVDERTRVIKGADDDDDDNNESTRKTSSSGAAVAAAAAAAAAAAVAVVKATAAESNREDCKRSSSSNGGGASNEAMALPRSSVPPAVGHAMSSGEDSSAESECDARKSKAAAAVAAAPEQSEPTQPAIEADGLQEQAKLDGPRTEDKVDPGSGEDKVKAPPIMNGDDKESNGHKVTVASSAPDVINEDENPKAFPSWTDEKLQESGIASFPDMDAEISEILNEEQLKKKCMNFSIGLSADRMTLSKRMELAVRRRDQSEQNFNNEVNKMQTDIKELAPLCVDSESLERVERVKTQLEMVSRCAHWISFSAETLGAVRQERRVSRAVLLADKYLQTLRSKCEKLASELAETKKILAENNIVLEENLSEMGDDVPRVRYRAVPNNNRTMMARRRASIATISRPLLGSSQDISKEAPRQRNSVSGRAPGVRRPSLCFEMPKWETDKLDRTDSSNSVTELREISEHTESRRHSREENNNLIRTSVNNLSTITSEHTEEEEEEVWSNPREDVVPDLDNNNETNFIELRQQHRYPLICWLMARYIAWKPMLWGILIAFLLGVFVTSVVSSKRNGPPLSWWSLEEILSQYIHVENARPRAI